MAGRHIGATTGATVGPNYIPGSRVDRAYSDGRLASASGAASGTNPHVSGTDEALAWNAGWFNQNFTSGNQEETAVAD